MAVEQAKKLHHDKAIGLLEEREQELTDQLAKSSQEEAHLESLLHGGYTLDLNRLQELIIPKR